MNQNRLFNALIAVALVVVAALTFRLAVVTAEVVAAAPDAVVGSPAPAAVTPSCPFSTSERRALRAAYVAQGGGWVTQTGVQAATGVDGGLLALLDGPLAQTSTRTAAGVDGGLLALLGCGR